MPPPQKLGRYEILEELGRGGFATVYKARDPTLNRAVALKVLHPFWSNDPGFAARFTREAQAAAGLHHPNVVSIHEAGEAEGQLYIAMAYLPGQTLRDLLTAEGALPLERGLPILAQVAEALDYAHGQGVVHRDVKPANVIVEEHGGKVHASLLDFGLVKAMAGSTVLTSQGTLLGSPEYMAPEQADPERAAQVGPAADRYALGIVAYHMLTGRVPFPGNTPGTLNAHEHKPVPSPRSLRPELPEPVAAALLKMLAKDPAERYPSACAFVEDLDRAWQAERQARQREAQLAPLYGRLQAAVEGKNWAEALELGGQIQAVDPNYRDVSIMIARARRQLQRSPEFAPRPDVLRQAPRRAWAVVGAVVAAVLAGLACLGLGYLGVGLLPRSTATTLPTAPAWWAERTRSADGMVMVYVPAGSFLMGSADSDLYAQDNEKPRHPVTLDTFWIDRTEVTNAHYARCVAAGACQKSFFYADDASLKGADYPVVGVGWQDAADYCRWTGGRLPTEAEWEYAARGPDGRIYPWGDTFDSARLNFCDANCPYWKNNNFNDGYAKTAPVGSFPAGASWVGALDMAGNVYEWVNNWYEDYPAELQVNPSGPSSGESRVLRGGSWSQSAAGARAAYRSAVSAGGHGDDLGFRCVAAPFAPMSTPTLVPPTSTSTPPPPTLTPTLGLGATKARPADGMVMVYVPAGTFPMGSADSDFYARNSEKPQHPVSLDAFWIDRTEVSNAQYVRCVEAKACQKSAYADDARFNGADYPVVGVAWQDAADYCRWAGGRLPTEAEWEYAARGPDGRIYPWGDTFGSAQVNFAGRGDGYEYTAPVGSFPTGASWVGALNMAGNVWEWVNDWYGDYPAGPQANPTGPPSGETRVLRGSGWGNVLEDAVYRNYALPANRYDSFGVRCVVSPGK